MKAYTSSGKGEKTPEVTRESRLKNTHDIRQIGTETWSGLWWKRITSLSEAVRRENGDGVVREPGGL